ncbi:MAG: mechanosensitive ion channel [Myxococcota bacterium]|jgi:small conductance mechanosensitive channel|nr:mechanosensitive ion channel [Myxococcota bacterium]
MDLQKLIDSTVALVTQWGLRIVGAIVALFLAWMIAGWLSRTMLRALEGRKFDATLSRFFAKLVRYAILVAAILSVLGIFGIQTTSFAAIIGAAGLAIGLAFQGTLSSFAAGVMLLIFRPFKVGDYVTVNGQSGTVKEIELFTTCLTTVDNRVIILPNSQVFGHTIENLTANDTRRVDISVGVAYGADLDQTRTVLEAAVKTIPRSLHDPAPQVFLSSLGASSVNWALRVWTKTEDYWLVYEDTIKVTKLALDSAGLSIPFPQMDVHFDQQTLVALAGQRPTPTTK